MRSAKEHKPQQSRVIVSTHSPLIHRPFVTQRVTFTYDDYNTGVLGNKDGKVFFTEYKGQELYSPGFSGCIMAAFKFLRDNHIPNIEFENIIQIDKDKEYIAHVFCSSAKDLDTKYEFAKLEKDGIIRIEAMYKPMSTERGDDNLIIDRIRTKPLNLNYHVSSLTGSLIKSGDKWSGTTYYQDFNGNQDEEKEKFNNNRMLIETYYLKGLLGIPLPEEVFLALEENMKESYINGLRVYFNNLEH